MVLGDVLLGYSGLTGVLGGSETTHSIKRYGHAPFKSSHRLMNYITQPTISGRVTGSLFYFGLYQSHCLRDSLIFLGLQIQIL